ncbi:MAG: NAD(P)H-hydrate dehydratase [Pedosphaera sp.]|nr:NAD(P)H-hydrate dehydratase [Pedosphaera sp.]
MPVHVLTIAQMREWEQATWAAHRTEDDVIRRVGHIVADRAVRMTRPADLVIVLAGKGHNGDDARRASHNLFDREVNLINVIDPEAARKELATQWSLQPTLIIDGLFGIGLNRPLDDAWIELIHEVNNSGVPVLSIDVPSGLNADSGEPWGSSVRASVTLCLGAPKRGLLESHAWPYAGRLEVAPSIGLIPCEHRTPLIWTLPEDFSGFPSQRAVASHKGTFGHVAIIAGSTGYYGAAVLCAQAALRAQPGLVSVFTPPSASLPVACQLQAAMVHPWRSGMRFPDIFTSVVIGPGLAGPDVTDDLRSEVIRIWENFPFPVVADASALDWLPRGGTISGKLRVITPHPGEAARMLARRPEDLQKNRPEAVRELSRRYGEVWVVLKGYQTCIGKSSGELFVNSSGNPFLAQGGAGDVLAGYLGGLLADPEARKEPLPSILYGVWQHGAAADNLSARRPNWGIAELVDEIGNIS